MIEVWHNDGDQVLAYRRKNLIFVFNFNPTKSFTDYGFLVPVGAYDVVLNTDATAFGGNGNTGSYYQKAPTDDGHIYATIRYLHAGNQSIRDARIHYP